MNVDTLESPDSVRASGDRSVEIAGRSRVSARRAALVSALLLAVTVSALFFYKWGGSLKTLRRVEGSGALGIAPGVLFDGGVVTGTLQYFSRIWPALTYGIVIGAVIRSTVSPRWIGALLGRDGAKSTLMGAACGAPLMLCSCCVTPVFTGVHDRGAKLGPSLSLMLASPALNPAALVLTFLLLPTQYGALRVAAALLLVFALAPAIGRWLGATVPTPTVVDEELPFTFRAVAGRFARSLATMTLVTVPLIAAGVLASAWLLPHALHLTTAATTLTIMVVALVATLVALPTFFEIALALFLLQLGAPAGAALALLIAGPVVNLPSLLVLGRQTNARTAVTLAFGTWAVACAVGLATSLLL